jgi:hypothetical protein
METLRTYKSRHGGIWVEKENKSCYLSVGGSYISERIILPGQPSPLENDDWSIYKDLGNSLRGHEVTISEDGHELIVHHSEYGDLTFIRTHGDSSSRNDTYEPKANRIAVERTPHLFAVFLDFTETIASQVDGTRTIY